MMKKTFAFLALSAAAAALFAQTARMDIHYKKGDTQSRDYKIERVSDDLLRLRIPKSDIPSNAAFVEVSTDFATAKRGDAGYILFGRGEIVDFDAPEGKVNLGRFILPIIGMKTDGGFFWAQIRTLRHEASGWLEVRNGVFTPYVRYAVASSGFGAYDDIVIEYNILPKDAGYVEVGRAYRKQQLESGVVRPLKERIKEQPWLAYMAKSVPVRIQFHGSKKRQDKDFTPENEPPLIPVLDFKKSIEFADAFKKCGVGEVTFCSAGWQSGGYDGRFPDLFPIPEELGGEAALREFIAHVKKLGYRIHAHTNSTDCYTCSRMWNGGEVAAKNPDGTPQRGYFWGGGRAYNQCAKNAYDKFLSEQLKKVHELGFQAPHYIDVFSAVPPYMCADPKHPATRDEMGEVQIKIAKFCQREFGGFASEAGFDHIAGQLDYINYVSGKMSKWYNSKAGREPKGSFFEKLSHYVDGFVPLWEIAYHGIILSNPDRFTQNHTTGKAKTDDSGDLTFNVRDGVQDPFATLKLFEYGGRPIFYSSNFADVPRIKKAYDEFLPVRHLQLEFIEDHKMIAPDVSMTLFGNGEKIICNYGKTDYNYNGKTVKPMGYILTK